MNLTTYETIVSIVGVSTLVWVFASIAYAKGYSSGRKAGVKLAIDVIKNKGISNE